MQVCFWCYKPLSKSDKTRDHFISKPLWNALRPGISDRSPSCVSCSPCNNRRGAISSLFDHIHKFKVALGRKGKGKDKVGKNAHKNLQKFRKSVLKDILDFRHKIENSIIETQVKTLCLHELDEILHFGLNRGAIRVRAYCLWERAGRPPGNGEHFWLKAERQMIHEC